MATATLFNAVGTNENYTAQVTINEVVSGESTVKAAFKIIVTAAGSKGLVIKDLDTNATIWNGSTDRKMNERDLKAFVQEVTGN